MKTPDFRLDGRVALLAQAPEHHFLASTAGEDVAWGLVHRGVERAEAAARARATLALLGVGHLAERPVHSMSLGEQRRVALAGLLVLHPRLLLLDEPTSGLDPLTAAALVEAVQDVAARSGTACVWVTHDLPHVPAAAGRVLLLRDGRIVFDGASADALAPERLAAAGLGPPASPTLRLPLDSTDVPA